MTDQEFAALVEEVREAADQAVDRADEKKYAVARVINRKMGQHPNAVGRFLDRLAASGLSIKPQ